MKKIFFLAIQNVNLCMDLKSNYPFFRIKKSKMDIVIYRIFPSPIQLNNAETEMFVIQLLTKNWQGIELTTRLTYFHHPII